MNKKELIKKYEDTIYAIISTDEVLKDLKQLDEQKRESHTSPASGKLDIVRKRSKQDFTFCARKCTRRSESMVLRR